MISSDVLRGYNDTIVLAFVCLIKIHTAMKSINRSEISQEVTFILKKPHCIQCLTD